MATEDKIKTRAETVLHKTELTGMDVWSIVAPILAEFTVKYPNTKEVMTECYVMVFGALKEFDERRGNR